MPIAHADRLLPALRRTVLAPHAADRTDGQLLAAFVAAADADAFALLVRRHGPMVLGVCRRVVRDPHAADDAFQATFLVLARRAAAVRPREGVGNWLYGVAFRTAVKARAVLARRRSREKQVDAMPEPRARPDPDPWPDLKPVVDEELARLPDRLRLPVVLCDLEGRPQRAVARHLGVAPATLAARLANARRLLAARLTRRGVTLSGGALAAALAGNASAAVVPPALAAGVSRAAELAAAGAGVSGIVSAHAVSLSEGVLRMMFLAKLKATATAVVAALALAGTGVGVVPARAAGEPAAKPAPAKRPAPRPAPRPEPVDDPTFLRRLSLDLRGTAPTALEMTWFRADPDAKKREKVVGWFLADEEVRAFLARRFGVPPEQIRVGRGLDVAFPILLDPLRRAARADSGLAVVGAAAPERPPTARYWVEAVGGPVNVGTDTFWVTGPGRLVVNERNYDLATGLTPARTGTGAVRVRTAQDVLTGDAGRDGAAALHYFLDADAAAGAPRATTFDYFATYTILAAGPDSDDDFLRRAVEDARGSAPTDLELKYFREDKDPKKREKLLDLLLKEPAVAKKLGDAWKKTLLAPPPAAVSDAGTQYYFLYRAAARPEPTRLEQLLDELLSANKTDRQVLDAVTVAVVGRLPTEGEKTLTLAAVKAGKDRAAAWRAAARALAETGEAKAHAEQSAKERPKPAPAKP